MLLHILKKDLKRKRTMNIILLLFIILASTFLASSVSGLITITGAVDYFLEIANMPDYIIKADSKESKTPIDQFLDKCSYVTEYEVIDSYTILNDNIEIVKCAEAMGKQKYENRNILTINPIPENFVKVFDENGNILNLNDGELAMPKFQAEINNLKVGDIIKISCEGGEKEFVIKSIVKDAVFGSSFMGLNRLFLTKEDYAYLVGETPSFHTLLYNVNCSDEKEFLKEYRKNSFELSESMDKSMVKMCYVFDMLLPGILIVVSVCLILISFLVLRFAILFTLEEDYKEIGIMKAIGIRDFGIKGLYLIKYITIALAGAVMGFVFSFPFGKLLFSQSMDNFVTADIKNNIAINLLCAIAIVAIVLLFCFASTGKVNKYTAIEAIHRGENGERYRVKNLLKLHRRKRMLPAAYMACNDVISNVKRYLVLAAVFCIGTLLILLPMKAVHTLKDEGVIRLFGFQPASVFIDTGDMEKYIANKDKATIAFDLERIKQEMAKEGMEAEVWVESVYVMTCYGSNPEENVLGSVMQQIGKEEDDYELLEGTVPLLPNEVMITEKTAEELSVEIGDSLYFVYPDGPREFIVTGTYQSMMNLGIGFRVSKTAEIPLQYLSRYFNIQAEIESNLKQAEMIKKIQDIFPDYKIKTIKEYLDEWVGVTDQMDSLIMLITFVVLFIDMMITLLTMKALITRERGEIAMLKSIGFADRTIKGWQCIRILLVLVSSILLGVILSHYLAPFTIGQVFAMMGATSVKLVTDPLETYVVYPLILLAAMGMISYLCTYDIKKVDLKEINTLE